MTRLLVGIVASLLVLSANAATQNDRSEQVADLEARNVRVNADPVSGKVRSIGAQPQAPLAVPTVNEVMRADYAAMEAVKHYGPMFGIERPEYEMVLVSEETKRRGGTRHRYRQHHQGLPVLTGELLVNLDEFRRVVSMTGEISSELVVDPRAAISAREARQIALQTIQKWYNVRRMRLRASRPELWIVDSKLLKPGDRDATVAWRIEVTDKQKPQSIRELVFVDANTAGITMHINMIEPARNRETYTSNGTSALPGTLVCDESDPNCAAGDTEAQNAHQFAGDTYDFFFNEHGRDSLDDAGAMIVSTVNYSDFFCPNAFWNGTQVVYCTGLAVDDVVAHEITHGITENSSALLYYYQSGAINESLSDIWGEFVDLGNSAGDDAPSSRWLIGEDLSGSIGVIRDMADPPALGHPDTMSSPHYYYFSGDNGGVHFNSGIGNKAAYLMTDGDTFNGYTVNGLGISKVADIFYEVQTNLLTSGSDYADLYTAILQACQNLIGVEGITSGDCLNVQAAVDAVEMNTDPANFHPEAPVCIGGDPPIDLFFDNFESGTSQWNLVNLSGASTPGWIHDFGYASSGTYMLWGRDSFTSTDSTAEMNSDVLIPSSDNPYLHFRHSFAFEVSLDFDTFELVMWDGGFIQYSTDGGSSWSDAGPLIESGQDYNGSIGNNPSNPNPNHPAFGDESHGYVSTRLDLSSLRGQSVRFRWHTSTDGSVQGPFGWVLDDVRVYTCDNEPPPPAEVSFSNATYSVDEAGGAATITVSRTGGASTAFTIDYTTADLSASAGSDYGATSGTLSFAAGEASQTFSVPIFEDAAVEGSEVVVLTLSGGINNHLGSVSVAQLSITDNDSNDFAWIDDDVPSGSSTGGSWNWVSTGPTPYSGGQAHQSILANGFHQHYFIDATTPLQVIAGDTLYAYVYLDPDNPPREVMVSWYAGSGWNHNAYWGEDLIDVGTPGTDSRRYMGPLPPTGEWVRLEVPASAVGLEGAAITGMAFSLFDGRATWDTTGITTTPLLAEVAFSEATYNVDESDGTAVITVNRTGGASSAFTIDYSMSDLSAFAGADYTASNGTLMFADGENSRTFTVPILEDGLAEGNEAIVLTLSNGSGVNLVAGTDALLLITDNDSSDIAWIEDALPAGAVPSGTSVWVSASPAPYSGGLAHQSGLAAGFHQHYFTGATDTLQVQTGDILYAHVYLDPANPPSEVMLSWYAGGGWGHNAYWGADLIDVGTNGTASRRFMGPLPPTGQWVRLEVPAGAVALEGATVSGMAFSLYDGRATWDTTGVTFVPPPTEVTFSNASYSVSESGVSANITVSRTGSTSGSASVDYATSDLSATEGVDYTATSGTLFFAGGEDSRSFSVPIFDDAIIEDDETVALTLSNANGVDLGALSSATLTITDDDSSDTAWVDDGLPPGAIGIGTWNWVSSSPSPFSGGLAHQSVLAAGFHQHYFTNASPPMLVQTGETLYAYIYLDPANPPSEVMLSWFAGSGWNHNAYWGADLIDVGTNGTNSRRYMGPLPPTDQWVRLEVPASAVGLEGASVTGMAFSLFDGRATWDATGVTTMPLLAGVGFSEATHSIGESGSSAVITVSRTGSTSDAATVDYASSDVSATAGVDYTPVNGTLNFAAGEASQAISVPILNDSDIEGNEIVALTLSASTGVSLGAISEATLTIVDDDSGDVAWIDDDLPAGATPIGTWNWVNTPTPYSGSVAHQSTLAAGFHQHYFDGATDTMLVQAGDTLYGYVYLDPANPPSEVMLSWASASGWNHNAYWGADLIDVGVNGTTSRHYVGPLPATGQWVRLEVSASAMGLEGASVTGMAFSLYDGRATWDTSGTTTTPVVPPSAGVTFSDADFTVDEAGATAVITLSRTGGTSGTVTVDYATSDESATAGVDYTATSGTAVFADGEASQTFSVSILDDAMAEGDETVMLSLSNATGAQLGAIFEATLTITDDDSSDVTWFDDALPAGATPFNAWNWVDTAPTPYSGGLAHQSTLAAGLHQHYFTGATAPMQVLTGDTLYIYIYLDPANPPGEVMLSWYTGGNWIHNAYWGADLINIGTNGTTSRWYMGPLPPTGQWTRLEVPASVMGLEGSAVSGMAFTLFDGRATWDATGRTPLY